MKYPKVLFAALGVAVLAAAPALIGKFKSSPLALDALRDALYDFKLPTPDDIVHIRIIDDDQQISSVVPKNVSGPEGVPVPGDLQIQNVSPENLKALVKKALEAYRAGGEINKGGHRMSVEVSEKKGELLITKIIIERQNTCNASVCEKLRYGLKQFTVDRSAKITLSRWEKFRFSISPVTGVIAPEVEHFIVDKVRSYDRPSYSRLAPGEDKEHLLLMGGDFEWKEDDEATFSLFDREMQELLKEELEYWTR